jgi:hypothetical protein
VLGVELEVACQVGDAEQEVAELVLQPVAGRAHCDLAAQLGDLFFHLVEHLVHMRPVEADAGGAPGQLLGAGEGGHAERHAVECAAGGFFGALGCLLRFPVRGLRVRVRHRRVAEDMRVAAHHLIGDAAGDVLESEGLLLLRHARVVDHLQQQVAELFLEVRHVAPGDGVGDLVSLLDGVRRDGVEALLQVPGATALGRAQPGHHLDQSVGLSAHCLTRCVTLNRAAFRR